ncbi:serine/threonine protein kinase [Ureibacillus acetophenoni]|uniref:Serine/threonine protein kinase n=1 Tax=Ureibacillus acetophenoni TaxID=614649 RepID=A0A285URE9_9BACL|nr:serine/threonine protein kinase [Ureibacillus acetophenoni]SOC44440.1 hypothetical protein SAMN05877842_12024 [Ureibacillus acetophenoni]
MGTEWEEAIDSITSVTVTANPNNEPVTTKGIPDDLRCIGIGTDAAVFKYLKAPGYAFKKYANEKIDKVKIEEKVYHMLMDSPFFSKCYASYDDFLVLSFEEGITFYDCILQGIHIPYQVILDVEDARAYARTKGLNPRDIHLKNILLQNGRAKILDVSEYLKPGNDYRWELLKKGYEQYYPLIDGKPVPFWLVESVRKLYNLHVRYISDGD